MSHTTPDNVTEYDPTEVRELTKMQTLGGHMWNHPAVSGRYLLLRNNGEAACYELPTADESPATRPATTPAH